MAAAGGVDGREGLGTVLGVGGGGGGSLTAHNDAWSPNYTASAIDGQIVGLGGDLDAIFRATHGAACKPLTLAGGGGGGGGFTTLNPTQPAQNLYYGASASYAFASDNATAFTTVGAGGADDDDDGGAAIGDIIARCRKQCLVAGTPGGAYYTCFCPCLKDGVEKTHLKWPQKIVCTAPKLHPTRGYEV
uniref:Uncharacterized protein n=1 Tax=Bicosoecida sp. CB-2014 TaxID=1486930 RepID=A0A7S1C5B5_9STRA